jgi:peptide/nickel transport system substrate-binding protein
MTDGNNREQKTKLGDVSRREFMGRVAALSATTAFLASLPAGAARAAPRRGGTLRIGCSGGSTTDSMDPVSITDTVGIQENFMTYGYLVETNRERKAIPDLAESWEPGIDAKKWIFNLRRGVEFHNGKTLDAEDVVYSINRNRAKNSKSASAPIVKQISDIKADDKYRIVVSLDRGNADVPYIFAGFNLGIVPKGFNDWANPVGTGPYMMKHYEPGVRSVHARNPNFWKSDRAWFDSVELTVINDSTARLNALLSGKVDVMNEVDRRVAKKFQNSPGYSIVQTPGSAHITFPMNCMDPPFTNNNVRMAFKHAIDRGQMLSVVYGGFGALGNDHPIPRSNPFFNTELPQRERDPERVRYYLKNAGLDRLKVQLSASTGAYPEGLDMAALYAEAVKGTGLEIEIIREPADGYWDNVWMKRPFCESNFNGRATADLTFSTVYLSTAAWNDAFWKNARFDELLFAARAELDDVKRRKMYWEMQEIVRDDCGQVVPLFYDFVDGRTNRVEGFYPDPAYMLCGNRVAERAWFAS